MAITLTDYAELCERENGGVEAVVVLDKCNRGAYTIANGVITALVTANGTKAYTWTPDMESAKFDDNGTGNRVNNSYFKTHTGLIIFKDDESVTAKLDEEAGRGKLIFFVKYARPAGETAKWKAYGFLNGMTVTTSEASTGQMYEDLRGHTLNLEGKETTRALEISDSIVESLLLPAS
jgi:hypothetical protein